jgi:DNA polymerase-1
MQHHVFSDKGNGNFKVAILIKGANFQKSSLQYYYVDPLIEGGYLPEEIVALTVDYDGKKAPAALVKECVANLLPSLLVLGVEYVLCADSVYYKALTGQSKADSMLGYMVPLKTHGFESIQCTVCPNFSAGTYSEAAYPKITTAIKTLCALNGGSYQEPGTDIIKYREHPETLDEIAAYLDSLHQYPQLSVDIEAFSLQFWKAGIGTIAFSPDAHGGGSFLVDYVPNALQTSDGLWGKQVHNPQVKALLRNFFDTYQGLLIGQNLSYDFKVLIYELYMQSPLDEAGKQLGIETLCRNFDDTKLTTYLCTNTCAQNDLSLKSNAQEFAGNWGQADDDIKDIRRIPAKALLEYNLVDTMSTFFVFNNTRQKVVTEDQEEVYQLIFKPSVPLFLQVELTGMPLNMDRVLEVQNELKIKRDGYLAAIEALPLIKDVEEAVKRRRWEKDYNDRKSKAKNPEKILPKVYDTFVSDPFNPNSNSQVAELLYEFMGLPIIERTKGKQPAVGGKVLKKLINHTQNPAYIETLKALIDFFQVDKILGTFIKAFINNSFEKDGWWYLHGNFNIGGTKSGRLSSSGPNLQNLPSGKTYGKLIKSCFQAPPGWIFCGADFSSLEDRISALTTKDPNKLKVYTDGFDGHCLRAFGYFGENMPDIIDTVESINSIEDKYPLERQDGKAPTFALTYQGTFITLMRNLGWSEEKSKRIEGRFKTLYAVSIQWVDAKLMEASKTGYVTLAFGLKLRTPYMKKVMWGTDNVPYGAQAEGRTAGNALGQGYCMLNSRAGIELQGRLFASEYRYDILPTAHIHDAQYFLVRDDVDVVKWLNDNLVECMEWQELPEIQHDQVKLGGALDLFYPSWADQITLPNRISANEIAEICKQAVA